MSESHKADGLSEFEQQLAALRPCDMQLDRAALLFRAGQESVRSSRVVNRLWCWRCAAVFFAVLSLVQAWSRYHQEPMVAGKFEQPGAQSRKGIQPEQEF